MYQPMSTTTRVKLEEITSHPRRVRRTRSVNRQRRVDLLNPRDDTALNMDGVLEACRLQRCERLCRPDSGLAVEHRFLVLRQLRERLAGHDLVLRDQRGAGNLHDLELRRLAHVDEVDIVTAL